MRKISGTIYILRAAASRYTAADIVMTTDLAVRKPFRKIAQTDFSIFPVWEWALDEEGFDGEAFVRPTAHKTVPKAAFAQYIVSANAHLRDGTIIPACVEVTVKGKRWHFAPTVLFLLERHVDFVGVESTRMLSRYTKTLDNYPTKWELGVPLEGETKLTIGHVRHGILKQIRQFWTTLTMAKGAPPA
jgi:hypothetical protein